MYMYIQYLTCSQGAQFMCSFFAKNINFLCVWATNSSLVVMKSTVSGRHKNPFAFPQSTYIFRASLARVAEVVGSGVVSAQPLDQAVTEC